MTKEYRMSENNILLRHNGKEISIAQHREYSPGQDGAEDWTNTYVQEIAVIPGDKSEDWDIKLYAATLNELIEALVQVRDKL
mgnify:FL=1